MEGVEFGALGSAQETEGNTLKSELNIFGLHWEMVTLSWVSGAGRIPQQNITAKRNVIQVMEDSSSPPQP